MTTAALSTKFPTLADVASRLDPGGKVDSIAELLSQENQLLEDMVVIEANDGTGHKSTIRTGLPTGTWRKLNYGVLPSKSTTAQVRDTCGMLEDYNEVDKALADLNGNTAAFRLSEATATLEGLSQTMATTLFFGDQTVDIEKFTGLAPRYGALSGANISQNIINGGGQSTNNTSVWLICWGPTTVHAIYPKGSKAGLSQQDLGEQTLIDAAGGRYQGYRTHFKWDMGLVVRDWRYAVRLCNIDMSELSGETAAATDLIKNMIRMFYRIPSPGRGRMAYYANRTISEMLHIQALGKASNQITVENVAGKPVTSLLGIPIRRCDALVTEARVL
jgi:hypothetical protein